MFQDLFLEVKKLKIEETKKDRNTEMQLLYLWHFQVYGSSFELINYNDPLDFCVALIMWIIQKCE